MNTTSTPKGALSCAFGVFHIHMAKGSVNPEAVPHGAMPYCPKTVANPVTGAVVVVVIVVVVVVVVVLVVVVVVVVLVVVVVRLVLER